MFEQVYNVDTLPLKENLHSSVRINICLSNKSLLFSRPQSAFSFRRTHARYDPSGGSARVNCYCWTRHFAHDDNKKLRFSRKLQLNSVREGTQLSYTSSWISINNLRSVSLRDKKNVIFLWKVTLRRWIVSFRVLRVNSGGIVEKIGISKIAIEYLQAQQRHHTKNMEYTNIADGFESHGSLWIWL